MNRSFPLRRAASARPHPVFPCRVLLGAVLLRSAASRRSRPMMA